jgi:mono/diheme cytochrome c family protein
VKRLAAAILIAASPAAAQEGDLGRLVYGAHCAACHGAGGQGDGPIAGLLTVEPPDLTGIQRANGGVFPFARVYGIIEGGGGIEAHGGSEMPAWGERLLTDAYLIYGVRVAEEQREVFVRSRILALIDHIARLQVQ